MFKNLLLTLGTLCLTQSIAIANSLDDFKINGPDREINFEPPKEQKQMPNPSFGFHSASDSSFCADADKYQINGNKIRITFSGVEAKGMLMAAPGMYQRFLHCSPVVRLVTEDGTGIRVKSMTLSAPTVAPSGIHIRKNLYSSAVDAKVPGSVTSIAPGDTHELTVISGGEKVLGCEANQKGELVSISALLVWELGLTKNSGEVGTTPPASFTIGEVTLDIAHSHNKNGYYLEIDIEPVWCPG
jgi:hypothetical protein